MGLRQGDLRPSAPWQRRIWVRGQAWLRHERTLLCGHRHPRSPAPRGVRRICRRQHPEDDWFHPHPPRRRPVDGPPRPRRDRRRLGAIPRGLQSQFREGPERHGDEPIREGHRGEARSFRDVRPRRYFFGRWLVPRPGRHPPRRGPSPRLRRSVPVPVGPALRTRLVGCHRAGICCAGPSLLRMRPLDPADGQPILVAVAAQAHSKGTTKPASSLLILSSKSGSMTPEVEAKLRKAFASSLIVEFDPKMDLEKLVAPRALIVVAGGDGTIGWVVRRLVDTKHPLGILSLGTFNNFAKSLHLPTTVDAAIRVIKSGKPHPITLGKLNGKIFLEAAAIGLFGETIAAGESAKDRAFGAFAEDMKHIAEARPFTYELSGDIRGSGSCMSLVFTNTTSIGSQMPVSDKTPIDTYLVVQNDVLPFDFPIALFIQQLNWGPIAYPMELINASAGIWQVLIGAVAIIALFIFERRAGWLMLIGSISSLLDNIIKLIISRQRPPADLVHNLSPTTGFSFPSGHAVFFTWMSFMIAVSIAPL